MKEQTIGTPVQRPRRLRQKSSIRRLIEDIHVTVNDLIQPIFITEGNLAPTEVSSMPNIYRRNLNDTLQYCEDLLRVGIKAIAPFPQIDPKYKTRDGNHALDPNCFLYKALHKIKTNFPELIIFSDLALDPYTTHGHDGIVDENGYVLNDETVERLANMAVLTAETGADFVAPSDMMDGRVGAIRQSLDQAGWQNTGILSYCVKYASAYYGPFRDAVGSAQKGVYVDKASYQMNPANRKEVLREVALDEEEGADMIMVKPAGVYLDIIREVADISSVPVAAYQVSGEYSQIYAAHLNGWLDLEACAKESLTAIKRAGANLILSYFSKAFAENKF
jgi:porphobilinogen synthase